MRELKFRVWSEEDKEYRTDCKLRYLFTNPTGLPSTAYNDEGDRFDIEQYTGLKDKNGKEIYEGDILRVNDCCDNVWYCKVEYDDNFAQFYCDTNHGMCWSFEDSKGDEIKVIGNIHKNPELLEVK